jgi:hypothetical protein
MQAVHSILLTVLKWEGRAAALRFANTFRDSGPGGDIPLPETSWNF